MPRKPILSAAQLKELLAVYHKVGPAAARELAPSLGISPAYVKKLAWKSGVRAWMPDGERWRPNFARDEDPRWAWAKQRGAVTA